MAITADAPARSRRQQPRLTAREDLLTVLFSAWLIGGIFVDGWAHNNDKPESFTPWHGLFYSGFLATAAWMLSRYQRHGRIPVGYGWGFVGLALFGAGGAGDMVWHMAFGVEVDLEALLSPTHLVLFLSGILIVTSPLRAAWSDAGRRSLPPPALLSTTILTALALWLTYFAVLATFYSVGWSVELWSGITVMSGLTGLGLATLMTLEPPAEQRLVDRGSNTTAI